MSKKPAAGVSSAGKTQTGGKNMSKNICVLTGARDSGMCKIYGYLRENGVNITGFHERCDLMDDSEAIMSEGDSVITKKDTENKVIMLTTKQTEALAEKARKKT